MQDIDPEILKKYHELLESCPKCHSSNDHEKVQKAFEIAYRAHFGVNRKNGEPFITHPIEVAKICASEIGLGSTSIVAALLHDVVEDTNFTLEDIQQLFGERVALIVDGLTKLTEVIDRSSTLEAENLKKLAVSMTVDLRIFLIKIADRLSNLQSLDALPGISRERMISETEFFIIPFVEQLGLYSLMGRLGNHCLKHLNPQQFDLIEKKRNEFIALNSSRFQKISDLISPVLNKEQFKFQLSEHYKGIYSISKILKQDNITFEEVTDLFALNLIFHPRESDSEKTDCFIIYSKLAGLFRTRPQSLTDYINNPRINGYEAIHCTLMYEGNWFNVFIRSERMNAIAERGIVANWEFGKDTISSKVSSITFEMIKELISNNLTNANEFIDNLMPFVSSEKIIVFTPKGKDIALPKSSTVLDFAYEIHTEIGNKCAGGKVNQKLKPVNYILRNGDQVEIITTENTQPKSEWLDFVKNPKAALAIKQVLKVDRADIINHGISILENKLKEKKIRLDSRVYGKLIKFYQVDKKDELHYRIGNNVITLDEIDEVLLKKSRNKFIRYWTLQIFGPSSKPIQNKTSEIPEKVKNSKPLDINIDEQTDEKTYRLATCCNPIPGDEVVGWLVDNLLEIHKSECKVMIKRKSTDLKKIRKVQWKTSKFLSFIAKIRVKGIDRIGIVSEVASVLSNDLNVNIRSMKIDSAAGVFEGYIDIYVYNTTHLDNLIKKLKTIKGVELVYREVKLDDNYL